MRRLFNLAAIIALFTAAYSGNLSVGIDFSPADFEIITNGTGTHIRLADGMPFGNPGEPEIPVLSRNILLPPGTRATAIRITRAEYAPLAGEIDLAPIQPPAILPMPGIATEPSFVPPDPKIYGQDRWFPENPVRFAGPGNLSGFSVAGVLIYPLRYNPATKTVEYLAHLEVEVEYTQAEISAPGRRSPKSADIIRRIVAASVINPQNLALYQNTWTVDLGARDYLIIAPNETWAELDTTIRLRLSLRRQGWNDTLITAEQISASYPGADLPEKIRNCIKDMWEHDGIAAVLLLGDTPLLGVRYAFAMDCEAGFYPDENDIPADLYLSDLDGSWNADANDTFGQVSDSVDLYPDVLVGRVSAETMGEFEGWLKKYLTYTEDPPGGFGADALFIGQVLWSDPYTPGGESKDIVRDESFPAWFTFLRLYESLGNANLTTVTNAFNAGYSVTNHDGHAAYMVIGVGGGDYFGIPDADALYNYPYCGVMYSIGCWPAAFDYNCIAEHFITNPDGGMAAFIGNSRYGWGSPGNPGYGYSDYFDRAFWRTIFETTPSAGEAIAVMKARYAPYARWENVWRWKLFEINLLGETGMTIWRDEPAEVSLDLPDAIPMVGGAVSINYPGKFYAAAIQDGELLDRTAGEGYATLWIEPVTTSPVEIAIWDPTGFHKLFLDTIEVIGEGPFICVDDIAPGRIKPGATDTIQFYLRNCGTESCVPEFSPTISGATVDEVLYSPETCAVGDTFTLGLVITADDTLQNGAVLRGALNCTCGTESFPISFALVAAKPQMRVIAMYFQGESVGDCIRAGETYTAYATVENNSPAQFDGEIEFACDEMGFSGSVSAVLPAGTSSVELGEVTVPAEMETGVVPMAFVFGECGEDTFWVSVGTGKFHDDAEGTPLFDVGGHWQVTDEEYYSGGHSYWCGTDAGTYPDNADDWLVSDTIVIGEDAQLIFWMRYFVTIYGADGLHIWAVNLDTRDSTHLDYVGSGGALPILFETGWTQWSYDIPYPPGSHIQIAFNFTSDGEDHERGFFLDEISVTWQSTLTGTTAAVQEMASLPTRPEIGVHPNPFNSTCVITLPGGTAAKSLEIYDLSGKMVLHREIAPDTRQIRIDGAPLNSGIYWAVVNTNGGRLARKIVVVK